ncbi:MAG: WhiB family transcriptional regulator [Actinomycetota bacterium]
MTGIDLAERPEWHQYAACRPGSDITTEAELQEHVAAFYPASDFSGHHRPATYTTKRHLASLPCDECPVRAECTDAGRDEITGIWGGQTSSQRRRARREARRNERTA